MKIDKRVPYPVVAFNQHLLIATAVAKSVLLFVLFKMASEHTDMTFEAEDDVNDVEEGPPAEPAVVGRSLSGKHKKEYVTEYTPYMAVNKIKAKRKLTELDSTELVDEFDRYFEEKANLGSCICKTGGKKKKMKCDCLAVLKSPLC